MFKFVKEYTTLMFHAAPFLKMLLIIGAIVALVQTAVSQAPPPRRPSDVEIMLVKNALTAVNHGNITGNYTVLRDLGSVGFQKNNTAAQLATIFRDLRERKIDLSPILVLDPQFTQAPTIDQSGRMQMMGFFSTSPLQVCFSLTFQHVDSGWMLDTVSLGVVDPQHPYAQKANQHAGN